MAISESSSPTSLTELSNKLHLSIARSQRLTYTLQNLGYLEKDHHTKRYRLGSKSIAFGIAATRDLSLKRVAMPFMEDLQRQVGETVNLAILDGTDIVYVERLKTQDILNINLHVGSRFPAYCTSMGKAMLAFSSEERLKEILQGMEMKPFTRHTITNKEDFVKELKRVKDRGFAANKEEFALGLNGVAAPIRDNLGDVIGAINVSAPSIRVSFKTMERIFSKKVIETANKISLTLGYHQDSSFQK
jgi:DNA-binding IclR family transcriptional regulator